MSMQNEMRRVKKTNLEYKARRLRGEIENLCGIIAHNLDCSLASPEQLPVEEIDGQWDELKTKWAELSVASAGIARLEEELS
jgi:hypothetical protein